MSLDLMKIFDGYVRNYHTLNLTNYHGKRSFTMAEIEYFSRLGSMLGYWTFTEDTVDSYANPMDLTWWDNLVENENGEEEWTDLILHLERENYYNKDEETLEKLFKKNSKYKPQNVIGIISVPHKEGIEELLKIAKKICRVPNALLIFRINPETLGGSEVHAYLLEMNKIKSSKTAYVSEIAGTIFMYFEGEYLEGEST